MAHSRTTTMPWRGSAGRSSFSREHLKRPSSARISLMWTLGMSVLTAPRVDASCRITMRTDPGFDQAMALSATAWTARTYRSPQAMRTTVTRAEDPASADCAWLLACAVVEAIEVTRTDLGPTNVLKTGAPMDTGANGAASTCSEKLFWPIVLGAAIAADVLRIVEDKRLCPPQKVCIYNCT